MHVQTAKRWQSHCRYHSSDSSGKSHHSPHHSDGSSSSSSSSSSRRRRSASSCSSSRSKHRQAGRSLHAQQLPEGLLLALRQQQDRPQREHSQAASWAHNLKARRGAGDSCRARGATAARAQAEAGCISPSGSAALLRAKWHRALPARPHSRGVQPHGVRFPPPLFRIGPTVPQMQDLGLGACVSGMRAVDACTIHQAAYGCAVGVSSGSVWI